MVRLHELQSKVNIALASRWVMSDLRECVQISLNRFIDTKIIYIYTLLGK